MELWPLDFGNFPGAPVWIRYGGPRPVSTPRRRNTGSLCFPLKGTHDLIKYEVEVMDDFISKRQHPSEIRLAPDYKWILDNIPSRYFVSVTHFAGDTGDLP